MDGLYVKLSDVEEMIQTLFKNGTIDEYQKDMFEIQIDSMPFIGIPKEQEKELWL